MKRRSSSTGGEFDRDQSDLGDLLLHLGQRDDGLDLGPQLVDDLLRGVGRRDDHVPRDRFEARQAGFRERRHVRDHGRTGQRRDAERAHLALANEWRRNGGIREGQLHVPGHHVGQGRHVALVGHRDHLDAGQALEIFAGEMAHGAGAGRRIGQLAGARLRVGDELGDRLNRQRRSDHQHERHVRDQRDRHEVLDRIVGQLLVERGVDGQQAARRHQQRVAVGRALGDRIGGDHGPAAGAVLDHERLAETVGEMLAEPAREDIGAAARRVRHDDGDLARGILLRRRGLRERAGRKTDQRAVFEHGQDEFPPWRS